MMSGNGTWTLTSSTNTFNGRITISAGTLALSGYGSVSNTPLISVTNGAVFDVSGLTNTFTLQTSQSLSNNAASTGTLKGNLNTASGTISVSYSFGSPAFNVTNGTLTLSASTVFNINNTGTQLGLGNYLIIATNANGLVAGTAPSSVTVGGSGYVAGATVSLAISNSDLYLQVSMPTTTTLTTSITPSVYGQSVTLTTTIAPVSGSTVPTGTVQFKTNGVAMGSPVAVTSGASPNGTAAISTANLPASVSAYLVTAEYAGSGNFLNSTNSPALSQTVNRGTPIVQTTPTAGAISYGQMLSSSTVVGTFTNLSGQAITMGSTNYVTPNLVPNFGTTNVQVYFVPQDTADYYSVTNTVSVSVNQATLTITASNTNKYYGQILTPTGFIVSAVQP
jgi:autotransporter-associated beta strand protein